MYLFEEGPIHSEWRPVTTKTVHKLFMNQFIKNLIVRDDDSGCDHCGGSCDGGDDSGPDHD